MRPSRLCAAIPLLATAAAFAAGVGSPHPITVVLKFDEAYSQSSIDAMKREFERSTKGAIPVEWRLRDQVSGDVSGDLVLFTFRGRCVMDAVPPPLYDETGPLAWTSTVDGAPLPFGQISCDHVRNAIMRAMWGADFSRRDELFGRALGRVLAHELYHMRARTTAHAGSGVAKPALSGAQLIADTLNVDDESLEKMER
jgi:hypothetical protein